jgi:hypothetical protein
LLAIQAGRFTGVFLADPVFHDHVPAVVATSVAAVFGEDFDLVRGEWLELSKLLPNDAAEGEEQPDLQRGYRGDNSECIHANPSKKLVEYRLP